MRSGDEIRYSRRHFLKLGFFTASALAGPVSVFAGIAHETCPKRSLALYNTHTAEHLQTTYWANGRYQPDAMEKINFILRDHRSGEIKPIHPQLLDVLHQVRNKISSKKPIHIISGYRSPETNALLRRQRGGVIWKSYHLKGQAIDFRLPDCKLPRLRSIAISLKAGGVGYYPGGDFVHVDIGPVRYW
jgi:uncharacterized protein YcbK (DUF882 family)